MAVAHSRQTSRQGKLLRAIRALSPEELAAVEEFVELLRQREDRRLTQAAANVAERAFRRVWDNRADAAYDRL